MSNLYNSGIQGYTLKGETGDPGSHSYNIFYSVFDCSKDSSTVIERIKREKSLSKDGDGKISYNEHDIIIDCKAHMYECVQDSSSSVTLNYIGNIINQTSADDTQVDMTPRKFDVNLYAREVKVDVTKSSYKYHTEYEYGTGVSIDFNKDNELPNGVHKKLVVIHRCGIVQEFDIDGTDNPTINDKYALMVTDNDGKKYNNLNTIATSHIDHEKYFKDDCNIYVDVYNKNSIYRFIQN